MPNNKRKTGSTTYVHAAPKGDGRHVLHARDSDERRVEMMKTLEVKRLLNAVEKKKADMQRYLSAELIERKKKQKPNPLYELKGAARPARETYKDPNYNPVTESDEIDLLTSLHGKMSTHTEGMDLLQKMLAYATKAHSLLGHTRDAIAMLCEMLDLDPSDHIGARHCLLKCYMDRAEAENARALIDRYPEDVSASFLFTKALIEHISLTLEEAGASVTVRNGALLEAHTKNPFVIWTLVNHEAFTKKFDELGENEIMIICRNNSDGRSGACSEALLFFYSDAQLWLDTDNSLEWLEAFIISNDLKFSLDELSQSTTSEALFLEVLAIAEMQLK